MREQGFALTELIVVIALIATLATIATLNFSSWQRKYQIEGQVKEMLSDFNDVRLRAIATKDQHRVILNPTSYVFRRYSSEADATGQVVFDRDLNYTIQRFNAGTLSALSNTPVVVDERGFTDSQMTIAVGVGLGSPAYNCLLVSGSKVNMGRINGNNCDLQ